MAEPRSTMIDPPIETLLDAVDSKFTLVTDKPLLKEPDG